MGPVFCYALSIAPLRCGLNLCKKGPRTVIARGLFYRVGRYVVGC